MYFKIMSFVLQTDKRVLKKETMKFPSYYKYNYEENALVSKRWTKVRPNFSEVRVCP